MFIRPNKSNIKPSNLLQRKQKIHRLNVILLKLLIKKQRLPFQILKQYHLFPQESSSDHTSISKYYQFLTNDDVIHTIVRKLQTKVIENKIWAFINIRRTSYKLILQRFWYILSSIIQDKHFQYIQSGFKNILLTAAKSKKTNNHKTSIFENSKQPNMISRQPNLNQIQSNMNNNIISGQSNNNQVQCNRLYQPFNILQQSLQKPLQRVRLISQTQQISYVRQSKVYIHRGSRSRSPSSNYICEGISRIIREEIITYTKQQQMRSKRSLEYDITPKRVITRINDKNPTKNLYQVQQIKRQYTNFYTIKQPRTRIISCGCKRMINQSCNCTKLKNQICHCGQSSQSQHHQCKPIRNNSQMQALNQQTKTKKSFILSLKQQQQSNMSKIQTLKQITKTKNPKKSRLKSSRLKQSSIKQQTKKPNMKQETKIDKSNLQILKQSEFKVHKQYIKDELKIGNKHSIIIIKSRSKMSQDQKIKFKSPTNHNDYLNHLKNNQQSPVNDRSNKFKSHLSSNYQ